MKAVNVLSGFALGLLITTATVEADNKDIAEVKGNSSSLGGFSYRPPMRGAPAARIGGGTRGVGNATLELVVLAPDHTGLTTKEQPTLYWYASEPVPARLEVTLINDESIEPELEEIVATPGHAGIQSINLAKTGAKLVPGMEYRWFVSVVADPGQRSNDVIASGTIQRIKLNDALKAEIAGADEHSLAGIYAKEGVWYDAIDSLTRMIEKSPGDSVLLQQRTALLEQVGLQVVANYTKAQSQ
ncbi:MAG: DUF928 domain-containing protein [Gammaproteobacteria bacterium]|nr:DUF928 domain-containing protein [Gammaproteobacteria bacterium]